MERNLIKCMVQSTFRFISVKKILPEKKPSLDTNIYGNG